MNRKHVLYRLYSEDGALLYIGSTQDFESRLHAHLSTSLRMDSRVAGWAEIHDRYHHHALEEYPDRASAYEAEKAAIRAERPSANVHFNTGAAPQPARCPRVRVRFREDRGDSALTALAYEVGRELAPIGTDLTDLVAETGISGARFARNLLTGDFVMGDLIAVWRKLNLDIVATLERAEQVAA